MKKKFLTMLVTFAMAIALLFSMSGCNYQFFDLNYNLARAYVKIGDEWLDLELKAWKDYEGEQLQLTLKDGTILLVSSVNCILYNGILPR